MKKLITPYIIIICSAISLQTTPPDVRITIAHEEQTYRAPHRFWDDTTDARLCPLARKLDPLAHFICGFAGTGLVGTTVLQPITPEKSVYLTVFSLGINSTLATSLRTNKRILSYFIGNIAALATVLGIQQLQK